MGRYYSGDIEGKFWVAVQPSDDADFFGSTGEQPNHLEYYFSETEIDSVKGGIEKCKENLSPYLEKMKEFFGNVNGYNDQMLMKELGIEDAIIVKNLLKWYARLELGEKILNCLFRKGECCFIAEL